MSFSVWKEVKLGDVCKIRRGSSPRPIKEYLSTHGMPWIKIADATESNSRFITKTSEYIRLEGVCKSVIVEPGALILSNSGTAGLPKFIGLRACIHDGWQFFDELNGIDKFFLYYELIYIRNKLLHGAYNSTMTNLTLDMVRDTIVNLPSMTEQKSIARILSTLDEKIEVNNQINKTLEAMAQALFKQWFIDFEFPNENGEPYKSSGGEMVESELGLIPKGWNTVKFTELVDVLSGGTPKTTMPEYWDGNIPFFTPKDCRDIYCISTEKELSESGLRSCNSPLYAIDTVFITARGTVGKIALAGEQMAMNQSCYALKGKEGVSQHFVYLLMKNISGELKKNATGSVFDAITIDTFRSISTLSPNDEVLVKFAEVAQSTFSKIRENQIESSVLIDIRDTLLPKLMSGEIRVPT